MDSGLSAELPSLRIHGVAGEAYVLVLAGGAPQEDGKIEPGIAQRKPTALNPEQFQVPEAHTSRKPKSTTLSDCFFFQPEVTYRGEWSQDLQCGYGARDPGFYWFA